MPLPAPRPVACTRTRTLSPLTLKSSGSRRCSSMASGSIHSRSAAMPLTDDMPPVRTSSNVGMDQLNHGLEVAAIERVEEVAAGQRSSSRQSSPAQYLAPGAVGATRSRKRIYLGPLRWPTARARQTRIRVPRDRKAPIPGQGHLERPGGRSPRRDPVEGHPVPCTCAGSSTSRQKTTRSSLPTVKSLAILSRLARDGEATAVIALERALRAAGRPTSELEDFLRDT